MLIKKISCATAKRGGEKYNRTFSSGTSDGINLLTKGFISDPNSDFAHTLMVVSTAMLFSKKNRATGLLGWIAIGSLWAVGQNPKAIRQRKRQHLCIDKTARE